MSPKHSPVSPTARRPHIAVAIMAVVLTALALLPVSYTHLTLPTNREG